MKAKVIVVISALLIALLLALSALSADNAFGKSSGMMEDRRQAVWPVIILYGPFSQAYEAFPYPCGPFPENQKYGSLRDHRCVYPYYEQPPAHDEGKLPRFVRLSDDVSARWSTPNAIEMAWHGNPNGVTRVEFSLLDSGRVVIHRATLAHPPYAAVIQVPYRAVSVRVRTYGLLQSILQEKELTLPSRPGYLW